MKIKIGVSPIAWLNDDLPALTSPISVEDCLRDVKKIGYEGVENCGSFPKQPKKIKKLLKKYNLQFSGGWYSGNLLNISVKKEFHKMKKILKIFNELNVKNIAFCECTRSIQSKNHSLILGKPKLYHYEKKVFYKKLNELSSMIYETYNVNLSYHHHMGTIIQNEKEIDELMNSTKESVKLLLDTGHLLFARIDPMNILKKYLNRISHFHLKDVRYKYLDKSIKNKLSFIDSFLLGIFTSPGDGDYNFSPMIKSLIKSKYNGWIIVEAEQDPRKHNPYKYSKKAFVYLKRILNK